ncbi:uncharacterized protein LOC119600753 isoform X1 [Lucilia sericata]|uniref:uncharacterized protein LOC119600753 isoform X1 n=1 Tax=Lucilia sericata TaxID=13632 RepID=UPI0018A7F3F3|nr:uncharacterized protein LOC119600753 isoform X1 [Lucilia sericata]
MALLNKLFFPSSSSTSTTPVTAAALATTSSSSLLTHQSQTNTLSRTSSLASILSSSSGAATATPAVAATASTSSLSSQRNIAVGSKCGGGINKKSNYNQTTHSKNYLSQFPFDGRQVRILVYRECDSRGRRLLFDSNALEKVYLKEDNGNVSHSSRHNVKSTTTTHAAANATINHNNNNHKEILDFNNKQQQTNNKGHSNGSFIEVCEEYGYKHNRPNSTDISSVGEMVFGALAMSFRGTSLKVHWLDGPSRLLCSQVFLTPTKQTSGHSPYSTLSTNSLATPRTSICSEHGSIDGVSMNSFSLPFSVGIGRHISLTPSDLSSSVVSSPLDVPSIDQQSLLTNSESAADSGPRFSSTYSTGNDSGYSALSRGQLSSDQWSASYQYSTRSSLGSVTSESERVRKFSMDSNFFGGSSPGSSQFLELSSDGSLQRRISRNMMTSFENENSMNDLIGFVTDNYTNVATTTHGGSEGMNLAVNNPRANYCPSESRSNPEMGKRRENAHNMKSNSRRARLGLAVCVTMSESFEEEMELFCSEHIALLESMLSRLRASTERAYIHHSQFLQIMFQIWQDTQQWFLDLFTAPRIKCPVWLSITTSGSKYSKNVAERFIKELCWLLSFADTKDTNFFVSTMLTAILTHHLGWVPTVSPFNSSSSTAAIEQRAKLLKVSQKHPYNALWAQLGDLFGAIGLPSKLARTVIYGTEKLSIERLLNVLTYFIRCGEVRRSSKKEDFNKERLNDIVAQNKNEPLKKSSLYARKGSVFVQNRSEGILTRTPTCKQNLSSIVGGNIDEMLERDEDENDDEEYEYDNQLTDEAIRTYKKNEIPTVLAFRDSRFVQQELRIGNYLMDTGIEKNSIQQYQQSKQKETTGNRQSEGRIRLTLTTPDNVELNVEDTHLDEDGAMEAIEIESLPNEPSCNLKRPENKNLVRKKPFFWGMTSSTVKEGLSLNDLNKLQQQCFNKRQQEQLVQQQQQQKKKSQQLSLSDLITQNSMGKGERMTWGIEPVKENLCLEERIHFELCQKNIERDHGICMTKEKKSTSGGGGVVFVLGDNEPLVNIKKSTEDLTQTDPNESSPSLTAQDTNSNQLLCPLHQRMHNTASSSQQQQQLSKKHSGVKFNFEQYPQIVTNYMKSKNLLMSNYDLLMDKCSKLELQGGGGVGFISTHLDKSSTATTAQQTTPTNKNTFPQTATLTNNVNNCMVCNGLLNAYQTPSNATELEFETDEVHSFTNNNNNVNTTAPASTSSIPTVSSQTSVQTLISSTSHGGCTGQEDTCDAANNKDSIGSGCGCNQEVEGNESNIVTSPKEGRKKQFNTNQKKPLSQRGSISSVAAKCAAVNEAMHLLKLPIPGIKELPQEDEPPGDMKLPVGFVPSLFLSVNDHYIPDMVLQGTLASPKKWEMNLREDLALAAHSASLISLPAENIAIIADMENWDVKLLSSQSQHFPYAGGQSAPVGMSQLVSTMLETVQTMHNAGISAYECLSFMESKLQEIYLHSETLAAFLLETDFCSLSAVTTALNLSENDVPLLLSIASIHTPQISKKCGISFR